MTSLTFLGLGFVKGCVCVRTPNYGVHSMNIQKVGNNAGEEGQTVVIRLLITK